MDDTSQRNILVYYQSKHTLHIHADIADGIWYDNMANLPCLFVWIYCCGVLVSSFLWHFCVLLYVWNHWGGTAAKPGISVTDIQGHQNKYGWTANNFFKADNTWNGYCKTIWNFLKCNLFYCGYWCHMALYILISVGLANGLSLVHLNKLWPPFCRPFLYPPQRS